MYMYMYMCLSSWAVEVGVVGGVGGVGVAGPGSVGAHRLQKGRRPKTEYPDHCIPRHHLTSKMLRGLKVLHPKFCTAKGELGTGILGPLSLPAVFCVSKGALSPASCPMRLALMSSCQLTLEWILVISQKFSC